MEKSIVRTVNLCIKRLADVLFSFTGIVLLFIIPVFEITFILIKATSKGPAIFTQPRAGKDGKIFKMYKFRTMITEQFDANGNEIMSENRVTKVGRVLRKTSIDELPQLFNILSGDMSLVGPRPMLDYQVERCTEEERGRFSMLPGITGLAQAKGRNDMQWPERIQYDLEYVRQFNIWLDIKIIFMTVVTVVSHKGTEIKTEYRGVDRFSKHYNDSENNETRQ